MANQTGTITSVSVHSVGNKVNDEALFLSENSLELSGELIPALENYFGIAFKPEKFYGFFHEQDIEFNPVYKTAERIFANPEVLHEASADFAQMLYDVQNHPNIKGGEFYVVYFTNCLISGESVDAIGLFKSENKDVFLKIGHRSGAVTIRPEEGVNIKKLDKGCIIFNTQSEDKYTVAVVDSINKGNDARYWVDDFLHVRERDDAYHKTENVMSMCRGFISDALPAEFEVSKADQADLLNRSATFFKSHSNFDSKAFSDEVIEQPEVIEKFNNYRSHFESESGRQIEDGFDISATAVKQNRKVFKSVIKLDKNFHIYVHGNSNMIERGADEDGRKYYKVYFDEEN